MNHRIVSQEEWLAARKQHLIKEKEFTRRRDQLSAERRDLPCVKVEKPYEFNGPEGRQTLADLFDGRRQLIVYPFMFGPGWKEGCKGCPFISDHIDGANLHLAHHDVALVAVSRAPWPEFAAFKRRMGWRFKRVSSYGSNFNYDYHVSFNKDDIAQGNVYYNYEMSKEAAEEMPGISVFYKDEAGNIFHTYSSYARGGDLLIGAYNYLDLTPKGRNETGIMDWVRHHDRYEDAPKSSDAYCSSEELHA
ncbi:MAG: thioredoxin family protein [Methylobacter sp.]|nr:thioredoxin family protein [Methylobacter sp.]